MNRLLAGDVGSGKTAVAIGAALAVAQEGKRILYMAPTSLLAEQHFHTFKKYIPGKFSVGLLTGKLKTKEKKAALESQILIGTQALLFAEKESMQNVGLVIIDEQHRFGVEQRERVAVKDEKGIHPHILSLTATPIPRTLSLTLFGDIEISYLESVPKGRLPIQTHIVSDKKRKDSYKWIKEQIQKNKDQVFFICPLVIESEKIQAKSAEQTYEDLKKEFKDFKVGIVHGQMKEEEKLLSLEKFKNREYDILVATPVIEVGIDIPGATIIVIENAERFGLAQLHQLRGRVGRNDKQSYCLAFYGELTETAKKRLQAFQKERSGLKLSEYDLEIRGPGEVYGIKQAGLPDLHVASLTDFELVKLTREAAAELLSKK
jgi:ATP-dependent DNA helicase RecG